MPNKQHDTIKLFETKDTTHLLDRVAELSAGELVPETLDGGKVGGRDVLDLSPVNEVTSLLLGTSKNNQCIAGELRIKESNGY